MNKINNEEVARMIELHEQGMSVDRIARSLGRDRQTVYRYFRLHGIRLRPYHGNRKRKKKPRKICLRCDREFASDGIYNRICPACNEANANVADFGTTV